MNLDELQSVQSRERQTDSLQQLRESFYADAGEFIQQLREERDSVADRADDPFDAPEVNRLTDDINTAESTVEAIYERRVGKIVKMASLAAADMPAEEEGLTREERDLFETLVSAIESNRDHVLDVLAGDVTPDAVEDAGVDESPTDGVSSEPDDAGAEPEPEPPTDPPSSDEPTTIEAADLMGSDESVDLPPDAPPDGPPEGGASRDDPLAGEQSPASDGGTVPSPPSDDAGTISPDAPDTGNEPATPTIERATVRITDEVGEIFGIDQREYDLSTDDVVTLPEQNAAPLVDRDAAERLD
ncbi:DNA replication complex GINS family protein [Halomicrobium sp. IBSBa]|uniref:DNA replication complex GINS family protein n=1 Tax=Halomicrobium sp. IBSBa TaxID=2778916 RepID=UPI001ABF2010|nr:DNA replication complex GINS family protein [Halomicrobium sp. IBSBa]MBO4246333.1 DNA replication complex GINS family protein [Halomicrobium sp. IBSBa]